MGQLKNTRHDLSLFCERGPQWFGHEIRANALGRRMGRRMDRMQQMLKAARYRLLLAWERRVANDPARPLPTDFLMRFRDGSRRFPGINPFMDTPIARAACKLNDELFWRLGWR